ncbi:formiminoglutamase [Belliella baltica DSM 15883]|uniref:Formimidoylglutamase n=1 Tax=Belliella baltica (strain DSM 15883 / CIP 108006 / LMG 21964 / BA134) TaxID=866536 RepID=I3ZA38_BELBD|nr:formimidoylglutamase [Belliella baltica]AFL86106.1 formiminoglutamase [Belliella baltica DSM 15883]
MNFHKPTPQNIWKGRLSDEIQYWYQKVKCLETFLSENVNSKKKIALLGYAVDEGVRRNQGRVGTQFGPDEIRRTMGSMAYHLPESMEIQDFGTFWLDDSDLEGVQKTTQEAIGHLLENNYFPILLGGGHDLAFPHGMAAFHYCKSRNESLGIINLDAHFDLRDLVHDQGHSGSPFLQILNSAKNMNSSMKYFCLGIQKASNPSSLFETAKTTGTWWLENEACTISNWEVVQAQLEAFLSQVNKVYLSIDLDGFSSAYAPGVSAPSPMGFSPDFAMKVLEYVAKSKKLLCMDVVELNPKYDIDHCTAKLASRCIESTVRKMWE